MLPLLALPSLRHSKTPSVLIRWTLSCVITIALFLPATTFADEASARLNLSDPANPLIVMFTAKGAIYIELFASRAPRNTQRLLELIEGSYRYPDSELSSRHYDQSRFYKVEAGRSLRTGAAAFSRFGLKPAPLTEEIDAESLGLFSIPLIDTQGEVLPVFGISDRESFERRVLAPLYASMALTSNSDVAEEAPRVYANLQQMSYADALQNLGHQFTRGLGTQPLQRGSVALVSDPAGTASPELFIALTDSPWLDGRITPIGQIVEGLQVADEIGSVSVVPEAGGTGSTALYSVRAL